MGATQARLKMVAAAVSTPTWGSCLLHPPPTRGRPLAQHTTSRTRCHQPVTINTRWHQPIQSSRVSTQSLVQTGLTSEKYRLACRQVRTGHLPPGSHPRAMRGWERQTPHGLPHWPELCPGDWAGGGCCPAHLSQFQSPPHVSPVAGSHLPIRGKEPPEA